MGLSDFFSRKKKSNKNENYRNDRLNNGPPSPPSYSKDAFYKVKRSLDDKLEDELKDFSPSFRKDIYEKLVRKLDKMKNSLANASNTEINALINSLMDPIRAGVKKIEGAVNGLSGGSRKTRRNRMKRGTTRRR
jgi:hypothetical protein